MADLNRFVVAQQRGYEQALNEIKGGQKCSHWIWYIFPQIKGLGYSENAMYYGIEGLEEARAYLANNYLRHNLLEITQAFLDLGGTNPTEILGFPDDLKVRSCMTLFHFAAPDIELFQRVIDQYYKGVMDVKTITIINCLYGGNIHMSSDGDTAKTKTFSNE